MDEWKEILDAVSEHLVDLRATGTTELSLPPPNVGGRTAVAEGRPEQAPPAEPPAHPSLQPVSRADRPPVEDSPVERPDLAVAASLTESLPPQAEAVSTGRGPSVGAADSLASIAAELEGCRRCRLHEQRANIVIGEGNPDARLMFIGEGPGEQEDRTGRPFVGEAGGLLTKIIGAMGLERGDVYIANIVKCRPPNNRAPMTEEIETCYPFLRRQISVIKPELIVTLGAPSSQALLGVTMPISRLRGTFYRYGDIPVMPTYHPAYLLRNPTEKRAVWDDMQMVMAELKLPEKKN